MKLRRIDRRGIKRSDAHSGRKHDHRDDAIDLPRVLGELREALRSDREEALTLLTDRLLCDLNRLAPTSILACGSAFRFRYQSGLLGAPPFDAKIT
jgi:hypothetical protein